MAGAYLVWMYLHMYVLRHMLHEKTTLRDMFPSATSIASFTLSKLSSEYVVPN